MNRKTFYTALRRRDSGVFGTSISDRQVRGIEGILDAFATHGDGQTKTLAYALATAYHETAQRMVPVRETLAQDDATARRRLGNAKYAQPQPPYGHCYYGRGQVQLTWKYNYEYSSKDAGVDLVEFPDKALDPVIGARILIRGLLDGRWNRDAKGIAHYLPPGGPDDLKGARRTVNITDKWSTISGYYKAFLRALYEAGADPGDAPSEPSLPETVTRPVLRRADWGPRVVELQEALIEIGAMTDNADGVFGKNTETGVRDIQSIAGLNIDGIAGKDTWAAIDSALVASERVIDGLKPKPAKDSPRGGAAIIQAIIKILTRIFKGA